MSIQSMTKSVRMYIRKALESKLLLSVFIARINAIASLRNKSRFGKLISDI